MLRTSGKVKKSKSGAVFKEVKEHYLRKEISCGINNCDKCKTYDNSKYICVENEIISELYQYNHFIIPDENIVEKEIDLLENVLIKNVIILQSIMNNIKIKNYPVYIRLNNILNNSDKYFYLFNNECHCDTFLNQLPGESNQEWSNKLYVKVCEWYDRHCEEIKGVSVVCGEFDVNVEFQWCKFVDYIESLVWADELINLVVSDKSCMNFNEIQSSDSCFPEYISSTVINVGVKSGKYLVGTYLQTPYENIGKVNIQDKDLVYNIEGIININRALNYDIVAIEEISCSNILDNNDVNSINNLQIPNIIQSKELNNSDSKYGKIVGIIRRNQKNYSGIIINHTISPNIYLFQPSDNRLPLIFIYYKNNRNIIDCKICVSIDYWEKQYRYPIGHIIKILGKNCDKNVETDAILFDLKIPSSNFSQSVLNCLPNIDDYDEFINNVLKIETNRVDLRDLNICSIDPPGCTDIDDAIHFIKYSSNPNVYELGIHIADVTYFVRNDTILDQEAYRRATSVYLIDKRIDMLPQLLSSNLCSLKPNQDRLAFSVLCYLNEQGDILKNPSPRFIHTVIKSKNAFTYKEAQDTINNDQDTSEIALMLRNLAKIMKIISNKRLQKGALKLDSFEIKFELDDNLEITQSSDINIKEIYETNHIIEECMLIANILVANQIYKTFPNKSLLRNHPIPYKQNLLELYQDINNKFNLNCDINNLSMSQFLQKINLLNNNQLLNNIIHTISIRYLKQATYISSGEYLYDFYYHYGLAESIYTHFTSPIRRYSDIIVHRLLSASINYYNDDHLQNSFITNINSSVIQKMCYHLNQRTLSARQASRQSSYLHLYYYLKNQNKQFIQYTAYVIKIHDQYISVYIPSLHYQNIIRIKSTTTIPSNTTTSSCNSENKSVNINGKIINILDQITVKLSIDDSTIDKIIISL